MDPAPAWTSGGESPPPRADLANGDRRDMAVPAPLDHPLMATTTPYNPQAQARGARPLQHHQYGASAQAPADLCQYQHHRPPPPPSPYGAPPQPQQQQEAGSGLRSPATQPWGARGDGGPASDAHARAHPSIAPTMADVSFRGDAAGRGPGLRPPSAPTNAPRTHDATTGYSLAPPPPTRASPVPSRTSTVARSTAMVAAGPPARASSVSGRGPLQPPQTHPQAQQQLLPPLAHAVPSPPHQPPPQVPAGPPPGYPAGYYGPDPYGPPPPGPPGIPPPGYHVGYPHDASYTVPAPPPDHFADVLFDLHHLVRVVCLLRDRIHGPPPPPDSPAAAAYGRTRYTDARAVRAHLDEAHATTSRLFMRVDDWYEHMLAPWIPPPPPPHGIPRAPGGHPGYAPPYTMPPPLTHQQQLPTTADRAGYPPGAPLPPRPPSVPPQFDLARGGSMYPAPPPDVDEDALQPPPPPRFLGGPPSGAAGYRPSPAGPASQGYSDPRAPSLGSPEDLPVRDRDRPRFDAPYHGHQGQSDLASPTPLAANMPVPAPAPASSRPWPDAHNGARGNAFGGFTAHHALAPQEPPELDMSNRIPLIQSPPGGRCAPVMETDAEAAAAANPPRLAAPGGEATGGQAMDVEMGGEDEEDDDDNDDGDEEDDDEDEAHTRRKRARKIGHPAVGHCLSCKTTEAPEWRRGPMGRGTLCNACGLHWAKLRRKLGDNAPMRGPPASGAAAATAATTTAPSSSSLSRVPTSTDSSSPAPTPAAVSAAAPADAPPRAARSTKGGRRSLSTTRRAAGARERPAPAQEDD
ncbi:hypothetical protein GGF32_009077 [Allomyces javanicus]|nr:hypothetical protein GGF32_009077 [Allomyces javanicus]